MALRSLGNRLASFIDYLSRTGTDASSPRYILAAGGTSAPEGITPGNGYRYHVFTASGTFQLLEGEGNVEYLVVAGGGGGGTGTGGGGGAGGVRYGNTYLTSPQSISIVVGSGAAPATFQSASVNGSPSSFGPIVSTGGGRGASGAPVLINAASPGGSGGGGMTYPTASAVTAGTGIAGEGNPGGVGVIGINGGAGGGGAGAAGANAPSGIGGVGVQYSQFSGPNIGIPALAPQNGYYGGGGGGTSPAGTASAGGLGGGGNAATNGGAAPGVTYTGGGGGANWSYTAGYTAGGGGSGIVILRYFDPNYRADLIVPSAVNSPGFWNFSSNGNLVLNTPGTYTITFNRTLSKTVKMWGAGGGGTNLGSYGPGGGGGSTTGTVNFTAGTYTFVVGSRGVTQNQTNGTNGIGGDIPGYGPGGTANNPGTVATYYNGTGGGGTGIHNGSSIIMVAGAGGGGGYQTPGGAGGGTSGLPGGVGVSGIDGGGGGTSSAVGAAGASPAGQPAPMVAAEPGQPQSVLLGSAGGKGASNQPYLISGGGGGGYYGGGGGGSLYAVAHCGGGGGSGYFNPAFVTSGTLYSGSGATAGNNTDPLYSPSYGFGGVPNATPGPLTQGGNGAIIIVA